LESKPSDLGILKLGVQTFRFGNFEAWSPNLQIWEFKAWSPNLQIWEFEAWSPNLQIWEFEVWSPNLQIWEFEAWSQHILSGILPEPLGQPQGIAPTIHT